MHKNKKLLYIILLYTMCVIIVSCNRNTEKNQNQNPQNEQQKEISKTLSQMEEDTENLIQGLWIKKETLQNGVETVKDTGDKDINRQEEESNKKDKSDEDTQKAENKGEGSSEEESNDGDKKSDSKKQGDSKEQSDRKDKQQDKSGDKQGNDKPQNWDEIKKTIEKLHVDWNSYEPQARKDGATPEMIDGFKRQLNALSEKAETQNTDIVLKEVNILYAHYPPFFNLYKHYAPPEIKKLKFLTRQIILDSQIQNWHDVDRLLVDVKTTWLTAKSRMENADMVLNEKIDYAIDDLTDVANQKKSSLVRLKGDILLQNLEQVK